VRGKYFSVNITDPMSVIWNKYLKKCEPQKKLQKVLIYCK